MVRQDAPHWDYKAFVKIPNQLFGIPNKSFGILSTSSRVGCVKSTIYYSFPIRLRRTIYNKFTPSAPINPPEADYTPPSPLTPPLPLLIRRERGERGVSPLLRGDRGVCIDGAFKRTLHIKTTPPSHSWPGSVACPHRSPSLRLCDRRGVVGGQRIGQVRAGL